MFKHVFKTMFIGVISSGLITTPVLSQTNTNYAPAAATSTATSAPDKGSTLATSTTVTTDQDGRKGLTKTYDLDGVKSNDMIASITGIAVGAIGARMAMNYKPITTDVMIAAVGGAAFIAGELMSNMKAKGDLEKQTAEVQMKKGMAPNQEQIEYFQKLKKSYEEAKSATKTKKTMQMAASVAFGAAAAMATYYAFNEVAGDARCKAAMSLAATQYGTCAAASVTVVAASEAAACAACAAQLAPYQAQWTAAEANRQTPGSSAAKSGTDKPVQTKLAAGPCPASGGGTAAGITAAVTSACSSVVALKLAGSPFGPPSNGVSYLNNILYPQPKIVYSEFQSRENLSFDKLLDVFFPRAQAGWMPMFGLAGGALASYFLISGPLGIQIDSMMYVARNRAIVFAGLAGLSFMAAKSSDNQIKQIEGNIAKIDAILKEMLDYSKGVTTANTKPQQVQIQAVDPSKGINQLYTADQKAKSPCLTSSGTDNCTSVEESITKSAGFGSLPPSMQALARETAGLGDSLSGKNGISGAALGKADSLGAKRGAVNGLLKKTQTKFNNASKGKKTDFDKEAGKFLGGMAATVKRSMQKNGISPGGMLASLGGHPMDSSALGKPLEETLTKGEAPVAGSIGSDGIAPEKKEDGENLNLDFAAAPELAEGAGAEGAAAAEYDVSTNEIHGENGPSIFEVISSRYLKSGYSKLLEEEQPVKK